MPRHQEKPRENTPDDHRVMRMSRPYLLSVSALAALAMLCVGVLLYTVGGQGGQNVEAVQVQADADRSPADPSARYGSQMTRAQ
jgi:hypothetical protein